MKQVARAVFYLGLGFLLAVALTWTARVLAAAFTVNFTAGQDTTIQTRLIPLVNTANCTRYGRAPGCTSANLVTGGCVAVAFPSKNLNTCTIYTADAAGETVFLQDELNQRLVDRFAGLNAGDTTGWQSACRAGTPTQQQNACTAVGLPATCNPCP